VSTIIVLHDSGIDGCGAPWKTALESAGWTGAVVAPDLPGHGDAAPAIDGNYDAVDAAWVALRAQQELDDLPIVVGVGTSGLAAQMLALAGRARAVALIAVTSKPPSSADEVVAEQRAWARAFADDPVVMGPAPRRGPDPRLRHGLPDFFSRRVAVEVAERLDVPVLVVPDAEPDRAAPLVVDWAEGLGRVSVGSR
jgi:pimeloyl-ACP methyl ester carboxylesterase